MDKIEKLELEYDDWKRDISLGSREMHIIIGVVLKVNEIIDVLNQLQKQPEEKLKEEDMLRWLRIGGVLKLEPERTFSKEELELINWHLEENRYGVGVDVESEKLKEKIDKLLKEKNEGT